MNTSYFENKQIKEQNCNNLESLFQFSRNLTNISYHTNLGLNIAVKKLFLGGGGLPKAKPFFAKNVNHLFNHLFEKSIFLHSTSSKIFWPKVEMKRKLFPKFLLRSISLSFCLCVLFCFVLFPAPSYLGFSCFSFFLLPSIAPRWLRSTWVPGHGLPLGQHHPWASSQLPKAERCLPSRNLTYLGLRTHIFFSSAYLTF